MSNFSSPADLVTLIPSVPSRALAPPFHRQTEANSVIFLFFRVLVFFLSLSLSPLSFCFCCFLAFSTVLWMPASVSSSIPLPLLLLLLLLLRHFFLFLCSAIIFSVPRANFRINAIKTNNNRQLQENKISRKAIDGASGGSTLLTKSTHTHTVAVCVAFIDCICVEKCVRKSVYRAQLATGEPEPVDEPKPDSSSNSNSQLELLYGSRSFLEFLKCSNCSDREGERERGGRGSWSG